MWLGLAALSAGAYVGLPGYMESLERRIVFRQPDCMDEARDRAESTAIGLAERGDSLGSWMRSCLAERQAAMGRHADRVGYGTMGVLLLMTLAVAAFTTRSIRTRLTSSRDHAG